MRRVQRYEIPIDSQTHTFELSGSLLRVATRSAPGGGEPRAVDMWAESGDGVPASRSFQVFATDTPIPDGAQWVGTTASTPNGSVWHLYEVGVRLAVAPPDGEPQ